MATSSATAKTANASSISADSPDPVTCNVTAITTVGADSPESSDPPRSFMDLPGELHNRIYRLYFDKFQQERKTQIFLRNTARAYLNIIHANSKIRSEAAPIFYEEYLRFDCYTPVLRPGVIHGHLRQTRLTRRIQNLCALVALHDAHLPMSITIGTMVDPVAVPYIIRHIASQTEQELLGNVYVEYREFRYLEEREKFNSLYNTHVPRGTHVFERRIGEDFRVRNVLDTASHERNSLLIEGPLAQLDWKWL